MSIRRGFTLIELLVVIAIIGLLASIVLAALSTARTKGQDAARISDIKSLETAMELYYADNGGYPAVVGLGNGDAYLSDPALIAKLVPKYIGSMPALLITDNDRYYGGGATSGMANQYGLYVYTAATGGYCRGGVAANGDLASAGWWGAIPVCNF